MINYRKTNIEVYDSLSYEYENRAKTKEAYTKEAVDQLITNLPKSYRKVLDIGCGVGLSTLLLRKSGYHVTGLDSSFNMLSYAKNRCPNTEFICSDILCPPIKNESFHAIHAQEILHLFNYNDSDKLLEILCHLMVKNGILSLVINDSDLDKSGFFQKSSYTSIPTRYKTYWKRSSFIKKIESHNLSLIFDKKIKHPDGFNMRQYITQRN